MYVEPTSTSSTGDLIFMPRKRSRSIINLDVRVDEAGNDPEETEQAVPTIEEGWVHALTLPREIVFAEWWCHESETVRMSSSY